MTPPAPTPRGLAVASVCSGAAALIAETLWSREFALLVGSTVEAAAATFAAFLVGLAFGASVLGRVCDRAAAPFRLYAAIELGIAATSAAAGLVLFGLRDRLALSSPLGGAPHAATTFGVVLAFALIPTFLMGATFPAMVAAARRAGADVGAIGWLYALNTAGAALGTVGCGFVLIRELGVRGSVGFGAALNLVAAGAAWLDHRKAGQVGPKETVDAPGLESAGLPPLLLVAFSSGTVVLGLEVAWLRLASYFLGNRTYAFSTLLACVLVALSIGAWLSGGILRRWGHRPGELLSGLLLLSVGVSVASTAAADAWIHHQLEIERALGGPSGLARLLAAVLLIGPMMSVLGTLFPVSLSLSRMARERSGAAAGLFYLSNTLGSVLGSLGVGFFGLATVGTYGSIALLLALASGCALALAFLTIRAGGRPRALAWAAGAVAALVILPWALPAVLVRVAPGDRLEYRTEDAYGVFQIDRTPSGALKVTNNQTQLVFHLGALSTSYVQQMQGHLGLFFHPKARSALVLGSGYGITAGALGLYPQLERIAAVEILPAMVAQADRFAPVNLSYHRNPKIQVVVADGRHYLARSDERWDIISVNISDPRIPGCANLFHADFYEQAKRKLNPGGVVIQHAFGSEIGLVLSTLKASFAHLVLFPAYGNGFNVVASDRELDASAQEIDRLAATPGVRAQLRAIGLLPPLSAGEVFSHGFKAEDVPWLFTAPEIASDDRPRLEFSWRGGGTDLFFSNE